MVTYKEPSQGPVILLNVGIPQNAGLHMDYLGSGEDELKRPSLVSKPKSDKNTWADIINLQFISFLLLSNILCIIGRYDG